MTESTQSPASLEMLPLQPAPAAIPAPVQHAQHAEADPQAAAPHAEPAPADPAHADAHAADAHAADAHADGHHGPTTWDSYLMPHEVPNLATLIEAAATPGELHDGARPHTGMAWYVNPIYSICYAVLAVVVIRTAMRKAAIRTPGKLQSAVELLLDGLRKFYVGIMGEDGVEHVPFLTSMFIFIWFNNISVLVPGLKSPSSSFKTTIALGVFTILYARYHNIKDGGFGAYLHHLAGSPRDAIGLCMAPLMFLLEAIGEIIKPLSLSLRLFGNIFGEDKLLATFLGLGMVIIVALTGSVHPIAGIPLHLPFFFLVTLLSTIQAVVFTLLAAIYILLMTPHKHEHGHDDEHGHGMVHHMEDNHASTAPQGGVI